MKSGGARNSARRKPRGGKSSDQLHRSVAEALRQRVQEGTLKPGSKLPTFREIAAEFGVSTTTVTLAINMLEREQRIRRIPNVGAFVTVRGGRAGDGSDGRKVLAYAALDLKGMICLELMRGIEQAARALGWTVELHSAQGRADLEIQNWREMRERNLQGVIGWPSGDPRTIETIVEMTSAQIPVVFVDQLPIGVQANLVTSDHEKGAYLAVRHMIEHGHRQILMLTHPPATTSIAERIQGYERALRQAGIEPRPEWKVWLDQALVSQGYAQKRKWYGGYAAILPVLKELRPPIAVLAIDAYMQWGVYEACLELGLRIPEDVSTVGFDDSEITRVTRPPMTFVAQRTDEIGREAIAFLERAITAPKGTPGAHRIFMHQVIDVDLVCRGSVGSGVGDRLRAPSASAGMGSASEPGTQVPG